MKKNKQTKTQEVSQAAYMKTLCCLRSSISQDYSKVIGKEKRAVILGYD